MAKVNQYRDPKELDKALKAIAKGKKRVLGLDLGTNLGAAWADIVPGEPLSKATLFAGQLDLSLGTYDTGPLRFIRLRQFLNVLAPDIVGYENVKYTPAGMSGAPAAVIVARVSTSAELIGALKVMLGVWAEDQTPHIPIQGLAIAQIKKYATGKGNANKVDMIKAAKAKYGVQISHVDYESTGADNLADALHICAMMIELYTEGLDGEFACPN